LARETNALIGLKAPRRTFQCQQGLSASELQQLFAKIGAIKDPLQRCGYLLESRLNIFFVDQITLLQPGR
jgi:hypothetical protein